MGFLDDGGQRRTAFGLSILGASVALGALGDGLFRAAEPGLNVLLFTAALVAAGAGLVRWRRWPHQGIARWMLAATLVFAAGFAWRSSVTLQCMDGIALVLVVALAAMPSQPGGLAIGGALGYLAAPFRAFGRALTGFPRLVRLDIVWCEVSPRNWRKYGAGIVRGVLIALPLLLIFGLLFGAADAVFDHIASRLFQVNIDALFSHLVWIGGMTWLSGGLLHCALLRNETAKTRSIDLRPVSLGILEIGIALGLVDLLFLLFVIVQVRYFFGGAALVHATTGLTYAQYARSGFFELVIVAALVLPMLLSAHWALCKDERLAETVFRWLAGVQVVLLLVIMVSAVERMRLYQAQYGLTELRFYTVAFMAWLAVVFIWLCATVLRGHRERFGSGALIAALMAIGCLHLMNPDAFIVRSNLAFARAGHPFDAIYALSLSDDAVPELVDALPGLKPEEQGVLAYGLKSSVQGRSSGTGVPGMREAQPPHAPLQDPVTEWPVSDSL